LSSSFGSGAGASAETELSLPTACFFAAGSKEVSSSRDGLDLFLGDVAGWGCSSFVDWGRGWFDAEVAIGSDFGLSDWALASFGTSTAVFVVVGTLVGLDEASVPDFVRATARSRRMTNLVNCCTC
jgi:hypothetical protein